MGFCWYHKYWLRFLQFPPCHSRCDFVLVSSPLQLLQVVEVEVADMGSGDGWHGIPEPLEVWFKMDPPIGKIFFQKNIQQKKVRNDQPSQMVNVDDL